MVKTVRERIRRNPLRKQQIMARELNVSAKSMYRVIREDLRMRAYRRSVEHLLTSNLKKIRYEKSKRLLEGMLRMAKKDPLYSGGEVQ